MLSVEQKICALEKCVNLIDICIMLKLIKKMKKNLRRWWVRPHLTVPIRNKYGAFSTLFEYFVLTDHNEFHKFTKMTIEHFINLHTLVEGRLRKISFRPSLPSMLRLAAVLW